VRTLLRGWADAIRDLGGTGAIRNARTEVDKTSRTAADLDAQLQLVQLRHLSSTTTRQAA
jgi:hypothetical protein